MRVLPQAGYGPLGLDLAGGGYTDRVGDITNAALVAEMMQGAQAVIHSATLHKPHVMTHDRQDFVDVNVTGTLRLLEAAAQAGVTRFVLISTTSAFGSALQPAPRDPAAWLDDWAVGLSKNIYGATKIAAEEIAHVMHTATELPVTILRVARFFAEPDDSPDIRAAFSDQNAKANEFLHRRVDLEDVVSACLAALNSDVPFGRYVISATTPFGPSDCRTLRRDVGQALDRRLPRWREIYAEAGYHLPARIDRVYVNRCAREELGWAPSYDFARILAQIEAGRPIGSELAREVGAKGYHGGAYRDGLYPV